MGTEYSPEGCLLVASKLGAKCLFIEGPCFFVGRILFAEADETYVSVVVDALDLPGFVGPPINPLDVMTSWGHGGISVDDWQGGQGASWEIYFDRDLVTAMIRHAATLTEPDPYKRYRLLKAGFRSFRIARLEKELRD